MKKLIIILIAFGFVACKDCTTCEYTMTNNEGYLDSGTYSQEEEGNCEISAEMYEEMRREELQDAVDYNNLIPVIDIDFATLESKTRYIKYNYTLTCD